ncbi:hypothetical protein V6Z11_A05G306800 [Gossypium hirsutum]
MIQRKKKKVIQRSKSDTSPSLGFGKCMILYNTLQQQQQF